jgi:hypothetical protein
MRVNDMETRVSKRINMRVVVGSAKVAPFMAAKSILSAAKDAVRWHPL